MTRTSAEQGSEPGGSTVSDADGFGTAAHNVGYVKLNLNLTVLLEIIKTALSSVPPAHAFDPSGGPRQRVSRAI